MGKRLYTEDHVRALSPGAELVLGLDAIATPAALDLAFARGVRVVYGKVSRGTSSSPGSSLWSRMLQENGTYVVEVRGGHAEVVKLATGGPVAFGSEGAKNG